MPRLTKLTLIISALLGLLHVPAATAKPLSPAQKKVKNYLSSVRDNRLDLALKAFGSSAEMNESKWMILREFQIKDPTPVGICQQNLKSMGLALAKYNEDYSTYPPRLKELGSLAHCPTAPNKPYIYQKSGNHFYTLACPTGHDRTPGFPRYSPIDGLIPNPRLLALTYFKILEETETNGLTKVRAVGATSRGFFDKQYVFTPNGGFVTGDFAKEIERVLKAMTKSAIPSATKLDTASFLLGMATFSDTNLIEAARCRLQQEKLYYQLQGAQRRMGEKSYDKVLKHLDKVPKCNVSKRPYQVRREDDGRTRIYCPGSTHSKASLEKNQPFRLFR